MKKIEAVIRKSKFEDVKQALFDAEIDWFCIGILQGLANQQKNR